MYMSCYCGIKIAFNYPFGCGALLVHRGLCSSYPNIETNPPLSGCKRISIACLTEYNGQGNCCWSSLLSVAAQQMSHTPTVQSFAKNRSYNVGYIYFPPLGFDVFTKLFVEVHHFKCRWKLILWDHCLLFNWKWLPPVSDVRSIFIPV